MKKQNKLLKKLSLSILSTTPIVAGGDVLVLNNTNHVSLTSSMQTDNNTRL